MTEIDFALSQTSDTDIIELVGTVLWNKADNIGDFEKLSEPEKTFIYIDIFESELSNGGLFDFFYNTSGSYAHQVLDAYQTITAFETSDYINQAIKLFPELPIPKDIFIRRQLINNLSKNTQYEWLTIEDKFLTSKEDIVSLLISFVKANKTYFEY